MKKITSIYIVFGLIALWSCDDYLDVNDDPFLPQAASPHLYLPQVLYSMAEGEMFDSRYVGAVTQNWGWFEPNYHFDRHGSSNNSGTFKFRNHYWATGSNLNEINQQAEELNFGVYKGITAAIRAWSWQVVTDHHGELPFDQAWDNTLTRFDYNSQQEIYAGVVALCDEAILALENPSGEVDPNLADFESMYNGDLSKWIKFAYAVKARNAHHISNKNSYDPAEVIAFVDNSFESNEDDASIPFLGESSATSSFMGPSRGNYNARLQTNLIISYLNGTYFNGEVDPRLELMFNTDENDEYTGVTPTLGDVSGIVPQLYGKYIFQDEVAYPLITYSELQFIKAEAAFIQGNQALAFEAFLEAIRAHMDFTGVDPTAAGEFIAAGLPQNASELTLSDIMMQKYIALYANNETWVDLRRYQYDSNVYLGFQLPEEFAVENDGRPAQRWLVRGFSEFDWNREALEEVGGLEIDYHTKPMWFSTTEE